jgi:hypothetical protein
VERPQQIKGFEDHQGQGSLQDVGFFGHWGKHLLVSNMNMPQYLLESNRKVTAGHPTGTAHCPENPCHMPTESA